MTRTARCETQISRLVGRGFHVTALAIAVLGNSAALSYGQSNCEVLIKNGSLYVGDGSAALDADVGIVGDRITFVGKNDALTAARIIDARGRAVAPGFVNMLSWSTESLIVDGRSEGEIRQGVTTQIFGEGQSMGPLNAAMKQRRKRQQTAVKFAYEWETLDEYLRWLERRGVAQNVASFVGAGTVREHVIGLANRPATPAEIDEMQRLVEREMQAGALGIGSALVYPPGSYATTEELTALCQVAARHGGMYISHIRNQADELEEAVEELIRVGRGANIPAEIYHFGAAGERNWDKTDRVLKRIEDARASGLRITANMHTYNAGCTGLTACLPPWSQEGGPDAMLKRLQDPATRRRIAREIQGDGSGWDHPYRTVGSPERILLAHFENPRLKQFAGKTLAEVAAARGQEPIDALMDLIVEDRSRVETVYFVDSEENVRKQVRVPWISFGSDAASISIDGVFKRHGTHPRAFGNFARLLGKYVREEQLISLEQAIHRLTGLPAANLGLDRRGFLREDYFADIVIFDPATIADRATFERALQYAVGVNHVFVNGVHVLADGKHTGAMPGRALFRKSAKPAEPVGNALPGVPMSWFDARRHHDLRNATEGVPDSVALASIVALRTGQSEDSYRTAREQMVRESIEKAEPPIKNPRVLDAMRKTPRHQFVASQYRKYAYVDTILPIGYQQTISPPFIVAYMTEKIDPQPDDRVLEIGTGSGYQAAVLSPLVKEVYTIEIVEPLGRGAAAVLKRLNYTNVFAKVGDGYKGWPEHAPFDKIIVTCSPDHVPQPLVDQLKEGGTMIIPVGERYQQSFYLVQKRDGKLSKEKLLGTFFVPMTGEAERQRRDNPDGTKPSITNGNFEAGTDPEGGPEFWYYQRGVSLEDEDAPEGKQYVAYSNDELGHLVHSNQGFAVDGKRVEYLELTFWVRTDKVRAGPRPEQPPGIVITFIDPAKKVAEMARAGPFDGTADWTEKRERISVPKNAEYAVIMIGLNGGTGRIAFDDIQINPILRAK